MGRKPDLPCDIEQVIDLLGIEVIRDTGTQLHCRCPFCADRKAHIEKVVIHKDEKLEIIFEHSEDYARLVSSLQEYAACGILGEAM